MDKELHQYSDFVDTVTSDPSKNKEAYLNRINELYQAGCDLARLDTGSTGLCSESGELIEIVKKIKFQGKQYNEENKWHMFRELGDILFYWTEAVIALGVDPYEVVNENIRKLEARYPGGKFSIQRSEVRDKNDL